MIVWHNRSVYDQAVDLPCRLLPLESGDGPQNMAADEVLLHAAVDGVASLRFYCWSPPTMSIGYFQPAAGRLRHPAHSQLPFVRRPSGGDALIHDRELTYCLALPAGPRWQGAQPWPSRMHAIIAAALRQLGISAELAGAGPPVPFTGFLCFAHQTPGDLLAGSAKVVGSAQRRQRGALMQHGGILLAASPHEPVLPGIKELSGHDLEPQFVRDLIAGEFTTQTGWSLTADSWREDEFRQIDELARSKYAQDWWNAKR
jgi:lipoate-protein ligase A